MKNLTNQPTSRREVLTAAGLGALALTLLTPRKAEAANEALIDATRKQIRLLRKQKRRVIRRIRTARGRRVVARNFDRSIGDAKRRLKKFLRDC